MMAPRTHIQYLLASALLIGTASGAEPSPVYAADWPEARARCHPVPLNNVRASGFLGRRIQANARSLMEGLKSPVPRGFEARAAGREPGPETKRLAADSDLYKWMEGAAYTLALTGDRAMGRELERIAGLVIACQQKDGYINTQTPPNRRFDPAINHDLYTAGHFFEAAAAHYRATGKRNLLDAAKRWADYLIAEHRAGNPYFETVARKEHSEYELGLLRLARATGDARYLDFSKTLARLIPVGRELLAGRHAVRVNYLLTGYADLFLETGAEEWTRNLTAVWDEIVATRSFVTGGVSVHEAYQKEPHWLPQSTDHPRRDIAETCTSISLAMFAWRLHSITGDSRYFDQIERILYNHYLGAVSLDHLATFYYNPLRMLAQTKGKTDHDGPLTRRTRLPEIHSTACCVTNEWRFFGALSEYLFSYDRDGLYVNLYTSGSVRHKLPSGAEAAVKVETQYPHEGRIRLTIGGEKPQRFALRLRVPAWCASARLRAAGGPPRAVAGGSHAVIEREWKPGDRVILDLDMPARMILPRPEEKDNAGQAVLARGPLVYCLEQVDAKFPIAQARLSLRPQDAALRVKARWRPNLLEGVYVLEAPGVAGPLTLVPFYARANRAEDNRWLTFLPLETRDGQ